MCVLLSLFFVGCLAWNCSCFFFLCYIVVIFLCVDLCRLQMLFFFSDNPVAHLYFFVVQPVALHDSPLFLSSRYLPRYLDRAYRRVDLNIYMLTSNTAVWRPDLDITLSITIIPLFFFSRFLKQQNKTKQTNKLTNKKKKNSADGKRVDTLHLTQLFAFHFTHKYCGAILSPRFLKANTFFFFEVSRVLFL